MKPEILEAVKKVHELLRNKGLTLAVAESCTGGLISHYITSIPGAGVFFKAGIVVYSAEMKKNILGVSPETLTQFGVVSAETVREMADRVRMLSRTDYSIATTGNLGPDVLEGKEKGLVYIAACREGKTVSRELKLTGDRAENKENAAFETLKLLIGLADFN